MVFEPASAPKDREGFIGWFASQMDWDKDHDYNDPDACTPGLRRFFDDLRREFPPMNGPLANDDFDDPKVTDYSIGRDALYIGFAWSEAANAFPAVFELAKKHRLGFFDVSSNDGSVWIPEEGTSYVRAHGTSTGPEEAIAAFEEVLERYEG